MVAFGKPNVFVVILNWNRRKLTSQCIESVDSLHISGYKLNVVVVDNASRDNSVEKLSKVELKNGKYKFIQNQRNFGYAKGNNVGIRYALDKEADYVLILNNDTEVDDNLVVELLKIAKKHPEAGAVVPKIYFAKGYEFHKKRYKKGDLGKVIWAAGGDVDWDNVYGTNRGVDEVDKGQYDKVEGVDFAPGTCVLFNSEMLDKVGLFDERYFMYLEDLDLSQRMKKRGWKIMYAPKAVVWHRVAQSSVVGGGLNDYFITRNRLLFGFGVFGTGYSRLRTKISLLREALRLLVKGRKWQKVGVRDFFLLKFGKGSWK